MQIPDFQTIMLPLMELVNDGKEHSMRDIIDTLAGQFKLSDEARKELLPSGKQPIFDNRVSWAKTHLKKAGLLEQPRRSTVKITQRGCEVLAKRPESINVGLLKQFSEYLEFIGATSNNGQEVSAISEEPIVNETPDEAIGYVYQKIRQSLAQDLLAKVKQCSPSFFEQLVVDLLVKMGYGGSIKEAGRAIGRSGDEGIDGIIKEDRLGLDVIYVQAKCWEDKPVGRPDIQQFVGALAGQGAKKGIFITTSRFSEAARKYAPINDTKIVLIDGEQLAQYMIDFNLGVSVTDVYEIKKIDFDYFGDE